METTTRRSIRNGLIACIAAAIVMAAAAWPGPARSESKLFQRAKAAFVQVTEAYAAERFSDARKVLDALWRDFPPGHRTWVEARHRPKGRNYGVPPFYYALRMLSDMTVWRLQRRGDRDAGTGSLRLTVVLIGGSAGVQPRSARELSAGSGTRVRHRLHPSIKPRAALFGQSLWLFAEYTTFLTDGRLRLSVDFVELDDLQVPVRTQPGPPASADLSPAAWPEIWRRVPAAVRRKTDWWWVIYPSHVPTGPDFARKEFITGGMAAGPNSGPVFLIDDLWLVRKPPHLGSGALSPLERRAYLPQWLQHEFFHHLFWRFAALGLEKTPHQWFDRATWPADFTGRYEPDYYREALHRRLFKAARPLHELLWYARRPWPVVDPPTAGDMAGRYLRSPVANDWHEGDLKSIAAGRFIWQNRAGRSWHLKYDPEAGVLVSESDNPYFASVTSPGRDFLLVFGKGARPALLGFRFQGEFYGKQ